MLDPWIIEEIRRREEEQRREEARIELPLERPRWETEPPHPAREERDEAPQRGVIVIDL